MIKTRIYPLLGILTAIFGCSTSSNVEQTAAAPTPWQDNYREITRLTLKPMMLDTASFQLWEVGHLTQINVPPGTKEILHLKKFTSIYTWPKKYIGDYDNLTLRTYDLGIETPVFSKGVHPKDNGYRHVAIWILDSLNVDRYTFDFSDKWETLCSNDLSYRNSAIFRSRNGFGGYSEGRAWIYYNNSGRVLNAIIESPSELSERAEKGSKPI